MKKTTSIWAEDLKGTCDPRPGTEGLPGYTFGVPHKRRDSCRNWKPDDNDLLKALPLIPGPSETKASNPKDAIGIQKLALSLVPQTAVALASLAHLDGALKYGKWNWRSCGVRASVYLDACRRHLAKWEDGEELDSDSGVPHLAHALACLNIIVDSRAAGKLTDDRPPSVGVSGFFEELTGHVKRLIEKHKDKAPRHYTIADTEKCVCLPTAPGCGVCKP